MLRPLSAAALLALSAAACSPDHWSPPAAPPPAVTAAQPFGYSGPMAFAEVDGRPKLYVAQGTYHFAAPIAVIDPVAAGKGTRGAGARVGAIDLPNAEYATVLAGDGRVIVAASSRFPTAWIIDPRTDRVTRTIDLGALGFSTYGANDAYVTAVLVDPDRNRAWLAVWNGFLAIDLAAGARVPAEDVLGAPSESPGYDPVKGLIYATFYGCAGAHGPVGSTPPPCAAFTDAGGTVQDGGLYVIRVSDRARFTLRRPGPSSAAPLGLEPDAIAVDAAAGLALVADEEAGAQWVLDLSGATLDAATGTVELASEAAYQAIPGVPYAALATHPDSGTVLLANEFSAEVALATSARLLAGQPLTTLEMPRLPIYPGLAWSTAGDPHGAALVVAGGKRYAFLLRDLHDWVARIDLDALEALSVANPSALSAVEVARVLDYLDVTSAP